MTTLPELSRRVSEAEGPSRELDLLVFKAFNAKYDNDDWISYGGGLRHKMDSSDARILPPPEATPSRYTASLDAVAALIAEKLPGRKWAVWCVDGGAKASIDPTEPKAIYADADTPALALLAATLLAIHERNKTDE